MAKTKDAYTKAVRIAEEAMPAWVAVKPKAEAQADAPRQPGVRIVSRGVDVEALKRKYFGPQAPGVVADAAQPNDARIVNMTRRDGRSSETRSVVVSNGRVGAVQG